MNGFEKIVKTALDLHYKVVEVKPSLQWTGLFSATASPDFLCVDSNGETVAYEVSFQKVSGSAERKLVFLVEQCKLYPMPTYIVVGGAGWSQGAIDWLFGQEADGGFAGVFSLDQLFDEVGV